MPLQKSPTLKAESQSANITVRRDGSADANEVWRDRPRRRFTCFTEATKSLGLPNLSGVDFHRRQPTVTPAARVNTMHESKVEYFTVSLFGVSHDHGLARNVRLNLVRFQKLPTQRVAGILEHRQIGVGSGVAKNELIVFVIGLRLADEFEVAWKDVINGPAESIRVQRRGAATSHPILE